MRHKKQALIKSFLALLLCFSMLVGSTFAWFTDGVASGINMIAAGTLDVELYHSNAVASGEPVDANTSLFLDLQGRPILWEPGAVSYENLRVTNAGDLALAYQLAIATDNENFVVETSGAQYGLSQILKVGVVRGGITAADRQGVVDSVADADWTTLENFVHNGSLLPEGAGTSEELWGVVIYWEPGEFDNYWNLNNGKTLSSGDVLSIDLGISLIATQEVHEVDAFGADYDSTAAVDVFPVFVPAGSATTTVVPDADNKVASDMVMTAGQISAAIPAGVKLAEGTTALTMSITEMDATNGNITVNAYTEASRSLDVHIEGIGSDNTVPMEISIPQTAPKGLNLGNLTLYHVENDVPVEMTLVAQDAAFTAHNQFKYNPATGDIVLYMATFSEVAVVADKEAAWEGKFDYNWYDASKTELTIANADQLAAFGAIVGGMNGKTADSFSGKTVKLIADINLGDKESENNPDLIFYPIGYYNSTGSYEKTSGGSVTSSVSSFEGTFDGAGHTISNFYQNTWEMFGDYNDGYSGTPNHYKDAMGLFGYVVNGTVKNLTVDNFSSDGEFTPTGVIAAYAVNSTFENIAIKNCNPRVYNTGNGGIVGIGGNSDDPDTYKLTFTNITIDNSNIITSLWGSWDTACGGLVGMFRGAGHVYMTNCHVASKIDVYNDVCGNYQYYWYRYSGMMVGTNKNMITDANGYTVPETSKFHAENCTVHFGEWNDYYYCELVANSLASYTHDHQFSRLTEVTELPESASGTAHYYVKNADGTITCRHFINGVLHNHSDSGTETVNGETVPKEDKTCVYLPFNQLFTGYGWGVKHIPVYNGEGYAFEGITVLDRPIADSNKKAETKFTNSKYVYRVGNNGVVPLGCLFDVVKDDNGKDAFNINSSGVYVTVDKINENTNVGGTFNNENKDGKKDWTQATIQFSGTGLVNITIQDYEYCEPTTITVEVVDAVNATTATSATKNNVVLLNDCGFSSLEVSGGYTLYGNGFTMTCGSDSAALDMGYSFVTLNNGTLDNVQIVCPNFDYAVLYKSNMTESGNRSETTDRTRYYNVKSGVMASGNSRILNSRISGGRAAVNVSGGNVVIDNTRIELGAVANILVGAANSLTLRDATLIQKPAASTYDANKKLMGFSVLYMCDSEGKATPTTLEGSFVQQAWVNADDKQYVPSAGQDIVDGVMKETAFIHNINGKDSLNLGFAYMPEDAQKTVDAPDNITDNRTDKATVPYEMKDVKIQISILSTTVYVYSYKNTNGTADNYKTESEYAPNKQNDIITVTYTDNADGLTPGKSFGTDGWVYELNVNLDKLSGYALDFSKLSMSVNGVTVTDFKVNGNAKPTSPVAVTAGGTTYTLTATVNGKEYTVTYKVTGTETSKESPSLVASNYEAGLCVASSYGGTWHGAAPALQGIQIKYWSVAEKQYKTIKLSDYTPTTKGQLNGTNTTWTYSPANGDFTLTLTGGQVHSSNNVYAMPVVCDGKLYFVAAKSNGLVNSGNSARTIPVSYTFKDNNNGDVLTFSHTWSVAENKDAQYKYSDFCNGTLTKLEASNSGGDCVTGDSLITLANGTQKRIDQLTYQDELLVWDFFNGCYATTTASVIFNHGDGIHTVTNLNFSDGTSVGVIGGHEFFDADANSFVYITEGDVADYVGRRFVKADGASYSYVVLESYDYTQEEIGNYTVLTAKYNNAIIEGMLTLTPDPTHKCEDFFRLYEVGEDMKYDEAKMQADIETYGLFTYEDLAAYVTYEEFVAFNGEFYKILVGKGLITVEDIVIALATYAPNH